MSTGLVFRDADKARIPRRQVLVGDVYQQLKSLIMDGSIPQGVRINIEAVSRMLDVSPTPVRESLARLESDGLVDKLPLKGYRTTDLLVKDEVRELYEFRLLIEPHSAGLAATRMNDVWRRSLSNEIVSCGTALEGSGYNAYRELSGHDERLHDLILTIAGNNAVRQAFTRTHCHLHIFRLSYVGTFGRHTLLEHQRIVDALLAGDSSRAEDAMRAHLSVSRDRVLDDFDPNHGS